MSKNEQSEQSEIKSCYFRAKSLADLCRFASTFSGEYSQLLFSFRTKDQLTVFSPGIKLGGTRSVFFFDLKTKASVNFISYKASTATTQEATDMLEKITPAHQDRNTAIMPVIELMSNPFVAAKEPPKIICVRVRGIDLLVKASINKSMEHATIGRLYVFGKGGKYYAGSFSVLYLDEGNEDSEIKVFSYAELKEQKESQFFRYDYNNDTVEPTNIFGEHSYLYTRVVNLAEPPTFFKLE
jgi:hypothetical protein